LFRNLFNFLLACMAVAYGTVPALAQDWPQRPIKIVIGIAPGGLIDVMGRIIATHLSTSLGQPVIVENRPGAGGNIAAKVVATSTPDGYTLLLTGNNHAVNPTLLPNSGFDYKSFRPIAMIAQANMVLVASNSLPANNITELVALAKRNPKSISIAISPVGTPNHLGAELLAQMAEIDLTLVPYQGVGLAIPDLITNRVQLAIGAISSVLPYISDGSLKALAVTRPLRSALAPNVPTTAESGLPNFDVNAWICLMAPGGTPVSITERLNTEIRKIITLPEVRATFEKQGAELVSMSTSDLAIFIKSETEKWANVLKQMKANQP
jgi:tripartite-type tricarboxylate transporter receptor subunit TctC